LLIYISINITIEKEKNNVACILQHDFLLSTTKREILCIIYLSNFLIIYIVLCLDILHKFHYKNKYYFILFLPWVLWFYFIVTLNLIYIVCLWKQYMIIILLLNIERHYKHLLKKKQKKDKWCYKSLLSFIYIYIQNKA